MHQLVALAPLLELVRADHKVNALAHAETLCNVSPEGRHDGLVPRSVARVHAKGLHGLLAIRRQRIRPEDIIHHVAKLARHVGQRQWALHRPHHVQRPIALAEAPVQDEDPTFDPGSQGQPVESFMKRVEHLLCDGTVKVLQAGLVEAEASLQRGLDVLPPVLMVPSGQPYLPWEHDLEGKQQNNHLKLVISPVNPVAVEDVRHLADG
mmetsp:Transcript_39660/g.123590  ORF Transcript_39660/g.123590 Transcript_39660/m.123590 type:complete len:208 (-) Transcript_39660:745-1368(-)